MRVIDNIWNYIVFKRKKVVTGKKLVIVGRIYVHGRKTGIELGDNCVVYSTESINPTAGGNHTHLVVGSKGQMIIGNNVGMSHVNITAYKSVIIEDNVMLGSGVKIWDTDFHPIDYKDRVFLKREGECMNIRICEGAFIGACSIILKGVTIGKHSVIGAGSIVTSNVPDYQVWAGNPARFIRRLD